MAWNYRNADYSLRKEFYCVIYCNFRHTFVPYLLTCTSLVHAQFLTLPAPIVSVHVMVRRPSLRLSVPSIDSGTDVQLVCSPGRSIERATSCWDLRPEDQHRHVLDTPGRIALSVPKKFEHIWRRFLLFTILGDLLLSMTDRPSFDSRGRDIAPFVRRYPEPYLLW